MKKLQLGWEVIYLTDEKITRQVDSCGRVNLPKHLRTKFDMDTGTELEFFTLEHEGRDYICVRVKEEQGE